MPPRAGYADWEVTQLLANALGYPMHYTHPSEIMAEIASLTPTFTGVSYDKLDRLGSIQWPCNDAHPEGTPVMHVGTFVRGQGKFMLTEYVPTSERANARYPLLLTTGRILSQYNVGSQTRRTKNSMWHSEDRLEIHPHDAEERGVKEGDWVGVASRAGDTVAACGDHRARAAGRGLRHVPLPRVRRECRHDRKLGLGHELPRSTRSPPCRSRASASPPTGNGATRGRIASSARCSPAPCPFRRTAMARVEAAPRARAVPGGGGPRNAGGRGQAHGRALARRRA
jgi:hypothetical protein